MALCFFTLPPPLSGWGWGWGRSCWRCCAAHCCLSTLCGRVLESTLRLHPLLLLLLLLLLGVVVVVPVKPLCFHSSGVLEGPEV